MKLLTTVILFLASHFYSVGQGNTNYDSVLAKKLNADAYGMKKYVMVILKTGKTVITDKTKTDSIFKGHMANIMSLAAQNKLAVAGPLGKNDNKYEGIFVFNTSDIAEAKKLVDTDPAVQAGVLDAELYTWYASAALQKIVEIHNTIQKTKF